MVEVAVGELGGFEVVAVEVLLDELLFGLALEVAGEEHEGETEVLELRVPEYFGEDVGELEGDRVVGDEDDALILVPQAFQGLHDQHVVAPPPLDIERRDGRLVLHEVLNSIYHVQVHRLLVANQDLVLPVLAQLVLGAVLSELRHQPLALG